MVAHKLFTNDEGLRQTIWAGLNGVLNVHAPLAAVAQQFCKPWGVLRSANQQHVFDTGQHEGGQWVVDHGFVVHRHELFANGLGSRVQAGARASGKDDAFACGHL